MRRSEEISLEYEKIGSEAFEIRAYDLIVMQCNIEQSGQMPS
jgi:hypothetical protein